MELLGQHFSRGQEIISKLLGSRRKAPRQVHDDIVSHRALSCWWKMFYVGSLTCLADDFPIAQTIEQDSISNTPSLDLHVIMEHSLSVTNYYRLASMRKFHLSKQGEECRECAMTMQAFIVRKLMWKIMRESGTPLSNSSTYSFYTIFHSLYR